MMITPLRTIILWLFHMMYQGDGHEDFNAIKMLGMLMLAGGSFFYVELEMHDIQQEVLSTQSHETKSDLQMSEYSNKESYSRSELVGINGIF